MRSGLRYLLAYRLKQPNRYVYAISRDYSFTPIFMHKHLNRYVECIWRQGYTAYFGGTVSFDYNNIIVDCGTTITVTKGFIRTLSFDYELQARRYYKNHQFLELLDYCNSIAN